MKRQRSAFNFTKGSGGRYTRPRSGSSYHFPKATKTFQSRGLSKSRNIQKTFGKPSGYATVSTRMVRSSHSSHSGKRFTGSSLRTSIKLGKRSVYTADARSSHEAGRVMRYAMRTAAAVNKGFYGRALGSGRFTTQALRVRGGPNFVRVTRSRRGLLAGAIALGAATLGAMAYRRSGGSQKGHSFRGNQYVRVGSVSSRVRHGRKVR